MFRTTLFILTLFVSPCLARTCDDIEKEATEFWNASNNAVMRASYMASQYQMTLDNKYKVAGLALVDTAEKLNTLFNEKSNEFKNMGCVSNG
jgi:hypothetical protein